MSKNENTGWTLCFLTYPKGKPKLKSADIYNLNIIRDNLIHRAQGFNAFIKSLREKRRKENEWKEKRRDKEGTKKGQRRDKEGTKKGPRRDQEGTKKGQRRDN